MYDNEKNSDDYLEKFDSSTPIWEKGNVGFKGIKVRGIFAIIVLIYLFIFFRPGIYIDIEENKVTTITFSDKSDYYRDDSFWNRTILRANRAYIKDDYRIEIIGKKNKDKVADIKLYNKEKILDNRVITFKDKNDWSKGIVSINDESEVPLGKKRVEYIGLSKFILKEKYAFKGDLYLFSFAMILFFFAWISLKYPLVLFEIQHALSVKDPEPSEFYMFMNYLSSLVCFIFGVAFATKSINLGIFDFMFEMLRF